MIEFIIRKRKITLLFFLMAIIVGLFSFFRLPHQEMPDVVVQKALVTVTYAGASPQKVEQTITKILEHRIKEVKGVSKITSTSANNYASILVESEDGTDPQSVWDNMRKKVQDAETDLPKGADVPVINDNLTSSFIGAYAITSDSLQTLYQLNDLMTTWKDKLSEVQGVSNVDMDGLPEREVRIDLNAQKMQLYHLSWEQVSQAISAQIDRVPIGDVQYNERSYQLIIDEPTNPDELNQTIVAQNHDGVPIYLKDIGSAQLAHAKADSFSYVDGKPAITINVGAEIGSDVPAMSDKVNARISELQKTLPTGVHFQTLFSQRKHVGELFEDLSRETWISIISVIVICTLGLNLITSAFVALAIPVSIAIGIIFLPIFGVTLNQISIIGLIIVLGILVDDAVVVNDNIERRLSDLQESPDEAALRGTKEVSISILTATLATISAFAPLLFLSGDIGAFIKPIPVIISLTMLGSMIMSLTVIPICRGWYETRRRGKGKSDDEKISGLLGRQIQWLTRWYSERIMMKVTKRPLLTGIIGILIGTLAYGLVAFTPVELFPESEDPNFSVNITMPIGTSLEETNKVTTEIAHWIQKQPETEKVSFSAGGAAPLLYSDLGSSAPEGDIYGQIGVTGKKGIFDLKKSVSSWNKYFRKNYPGVSIKPIIPEMGIPVGKPISVRITGSDVNQLQSLSQKVKESIAKVNGTSNIEDDIGLERNALELKVNKLAMDQHLINYTNLTQTLMLLNEGVNMSKFDTGNELVATKLFLNQKQGIDPNVLLQQLSVINAAGNQVPISQLVQVRPSFAVQQIKHYNLERTITVEADVTNRTATEAVNDVTAILSKMKFPEGYSWQIGGETSDQSDIFMDLAVLSIVVLFLIVLLITMQFYSVSIAAIIMTSVYLAAAGGILGIFLTGKPIGFMSIMGIIALAGIVVRNGIVLIEFIEDARKEGASLHEAVIRATVARFRPILLTSMTAIVGMLPIAIMGSMLFKPLVYTVISGLFFSTLLTLLVVPSLYMVVAQLKLKRLQKKLSRITPTSGQGPSTNV
ncbi:efflux RND transporter permease subunit [Paenibacillus polymyxa]|uniref:efflux RND transporter permease subunit n=1 Tax=Paenibacillus polymyxa TaxID=1406 RepID=UPI0005CF0EC8|nr:efflux RND transporter permease subunit [Paenibacillus polymyxa]